MFFFSRVCLKASRKESQQLPIFINFQFHNFFGATKRMFFWTKHWKILLIEYVIVLQDKKALNELFIMGKQAYIAGYIVVYSELL